MNDNEYYSNPRISNSDLNYMDTYADYKFYKDNPKADTPALLFGRAFHCYILEPDKFETQFVVMPEFDRRTKAGKESYNDFMAGLPDGVSFITDSDLEQVKAMKKALFANDIASSLVFDLDCEYEKTILSTINGVECRSKIDGLNLDKNYFFDLKTTESADIASISKSINNYKYYRQDKFYKLALYDNYFTDFDSYFIFLDKKGLHCRVVKLDSEFTDYAEIEIFEKLNNYKRWIETPDLITGYPESIETIYKPNWIK